MRYQQHRFETRLQERELRGIISQEIRRSRLAKPKDVAYKLFDNSEARPMPTGRIPNRVRTSHMATMYDKQRGERKSPLQEKLRLRKARFEAGPEFLGQNKLSADEIKASFARYEALSNTRDNLYAVIMPAGCGKTSLCRKYGFVDVDELVSQSEHNSYIEARAAIIAGYGDWKVHNRIWFDRLNQTLDLLDYSKPVLLFCHTEETAREVGATPIAWLRLSKTAHEINIKDRGQEARAMSRASLARSVCTDSVPNQGTFRSNRDLEAFLVAILNVSNFPIGAPNAFSMEYHNECYARDVPGWILRGERAGESGLNINELRLLFEAGKVPKECVDYYVRHSYVPTQFDFGVTMFEWSQALGQLPPCFNERKDFDVGGDMLEIFPPLSPKEVSRSNLNIRQLINTFGIFSHPDAYNIAACHVGEKHTFVTSLLACWKGILDGSQVANIIYPWFQVNFFNWANKMKTLHSLIRCSRFLMNTEIDEVDRQALMYLDLLVGRGEYVIDEEEEIRLRWDNTYETKHLSYDPDLKKFTNGRYRADFMIALDEAHMRFRTKPKPVNFDSFLDFYQRRASWVTKGGLVYNKLPPAMKKYHVTVLDAVANTIEEIQSRHNKKSLFEMHDLGEILLGVTEENFNMTKTMIKYEAGKKDRTLLPGSLAHFIVFCYVLRLAEYQMQVGSVRLNVENEIDIVFTDRKMMTGIYHVLYDWADFNEQHSAWEMGLVIEKLNQVIIGPQDYHIFVDAIVASMFNMSLQDREGQVHKIWRGLYSGWRGTTWVNTVLNFCYVHIALVNLERLHGIDVALLIDHGGDDIDLGLSDPGAMPLFLEVMDAMLFKANKWKQMFGTRSEFFRNTITDGQGYGSPTRALASFVAGDWEGAGRATIRERVVGLMDQIGKLQRRGCDAEFCQGLAICTISHWCKIREGEEWLSLPSVIIHGRVEDGGLGVPDGANMLWVLETKVPEIKENWYQVVVPDFRASRDYVSAIGRDLEKFCLTIARGEELARKLSEDSYDIERSVDHKEWATLMDFRTKVVDKLPAVEELNDDTIFEGFMDYEVDEGTEKMFGSAARYQEFVSFLEFNGRGVTREELVDLMSDGQVCLEAIEFQGDIYYARLVPEFIAYRATLFCREAINKKACDHEVAQYCFRVICSMSQRIFKHML